MYKHHTHCRACSYGKVTTANGIKIDGPTEKLLPAFDLGIQPLANDFRKTDQIHAGFAPLSVLFCPRCHLAQLSVVVQPEILYRDYAYVTSTSHTMHEHFNQLYDDLIAMRGGSLGSVLEIGSNDGGFLSFLKHKGEKQLLGVDPATNLSFIAKSNEIETVNKFWCYDTSLELVKQDVVVARHVFCHVDDWHDFVKGLEHVAHNNTVIAIEAPYVKDMLDQVQLDQVYHEHLSFLNLKAVEYLLADTSLYIADVKKYPVHGGAAVVFLKVRNSMSKPYQVDESLSIVDWESFSVKAHLHIEELKAFVAQNKGAYCGYCASAKSTVWINACGFTRKQIKFICDNTPQKQYRFSPGSDIPIVDEGALLRELPDYAIIFGWNFLKEIEAKNQLYLSKGGKFIVPVPKLQVISHT